mgnify:CR=1 FL=1
MYAGLLRFALPLLLAPVVMAQQPITFIGDSDFVDDSGQTPPKSSFVLDFGPFGGLTTAEIDKTEYVIELNAQTGRAQFLNYYQEADALLLPGGISTGRLTIRIEQAGEGTYDPATGVFNTSDLYAIYFDGDLSAFGISSPFLLEGTSTGTALFTAPTRGRILQQWDGGSFLPNPAAPGQFIPFSYRCNVNTNFVSRLPGQIAVDTDGALSDPANVNNTGLLLTGPFCGNCGQIGMLGGLVMVAGLAFMRRRL